MLKDEHQDSVLYSLKVSIIYMYLSLNIFNIQLNIWNYYFLGINIAFRRLSNKISVGKQIKRSNYNFDNFN